jgi:hypothetical protein
LLLTKEKRMRTPKIIEGQAFDWKRGAEAMNNVIGPDGETNWGAAMAADPGATKCPNCKEYYWAEGVIVECLDCGTQWNVSTKEVIKQEKRA